MEDATLLEEKRSRRRAKNKAKKEDARRAREEDIRRKLYEPKNQRVRLVDAREVDAWRGVGSATSTPSVAVTSADFPDLGATRQRVRPAEVPGEGGPTSEALNTNAKPRRADPIRIDVMSALMLSTNGAERKGPPVVAKKVIVGSQLHGNQLDSSNPERRKGKTRENPKPQKPSHLKAVILQDRQARQAARAKALIGEILNENVAIENENVTVETKVAVKNTSADSVGVDPEGRVENTGLDCKQDQSEGLPDSGLDRKLDHSEGLPDSELDCKQNRSDTRLDCKLDQSQGLPDSGLDCKRDRSKGLPDSGLECKQDQSQGLPGELSALSIGRPPIHSRKFREYCDHLLCPRLDEAVRSLIADIVRFQDRAYFSDAVKAHARRRFVLGLRETKKYLTLRKLKLVVIAPDLEASGSRGGIDDAVGGLKEAARAQEVPYVFSVGRSVLRRLTNKSHTVAGVSCVGVISYEGSQDNFHVIAELLPGLREGYRRLTGPAPPSPLPPRPADPPDVNREVVATLLVKLEKELGNN